MGAWWWCSARAVLCGSARRPATQWARNNSRIGPHGRGRAAILPESRSRPCVSCAVRVLFRCVCCSVCGARVLVRGACCSVRAVGWGRTPDAHEGLVVRLVGAEDLPKVPCADLVGHGVKRVHRLLLTLEETQLIDGNGPAATWGMWLGLGLGGGGGRLCGVGLRAWAWAWASGAGSRLALHATVSLGRSSLRLTRLVTSSSSSSSRRRRRRRRTGRARWVPHRRHRPLPRAVCPLAQRPRAGGLLGAPFPHGRPRPSDGGADGGISKDGRPGSK